jgi:hypothetical protein
VARDIVLAEDVFLGVWNLLVNHVEKLGQMGWLSCGREKGTFSPFSFKKAGKV